MNLDFDEIWKTLKNSHPFGIARERLRNEYRWLVYTSHVQSRYGIDHRGDHENETIEALSFAISNQRRIYEEEGHKAVSFVVDTWGDGFIVAGYTNNRQVKPKYLYAFDSKGENIKP